MKIITFDRNTSDDIFVELITKDLEAVGAKVHTVEFEDGTIMFVG